MLDKCILIFRFEEGSSPHLNDILKFVTGMSCLPPMKNYYKIQLFYLPEEKKLPEASACFSHLYLPVSHSSASEFKAAFNQGVMLLKDYFGLT